MPGPDLPEGQLPEGQDPNAPVTDGGDTPSVRIILCPTKLTLTSPQTVKAGDTLPALSCILQDKNGAAIDLTDATVTFRYRNVLDTAGPQSADASVVDAASGSVSAEWGPFVEGLHKTEFHVKWSDGDELTFPDNDYLEITVIAAVL